MYAKVFSQIYDGTLCTKGPWQALVTFQQLLVLADQHGVVDMTAGAIARRTTIPLDIIELGLSELMLPDPDSRTPTEQGKRIVPLSEERSWGWQIVNYEHYRKLKREEDRREYHREYWHKRKASDSTPTQHTQPTQPITEAYAEAKKNHTSLKRGFDAFWSAWPKSKRKAAKKQCLDKWETQGCEAELDVILDKVNAWAQSDDWKRSNGDFMPAPLVWLNQRRWEAEAPNGPAFQRGKAWY